MNTPTKLAAATLLTTLLTVPLATSVASAAEARGSVYDNCTSFNHKYPHGVGKNKAKDHTSGTPVTSFKRSTKLYKTAMSKNSRLDGDKDGVACEKA